MSKMEDINTVSDLINWNLNETERDNNPKRFLFRGIADTTYSLIPKIARPLEPDGSVDVSTLQLRVRLLRDYLRIHLPTYGNEYHQENILNKQWMELFIAQHHGVPTNLLDFSRNPLVALYFAVNEKPKEDGRIVCFPIREQPWTGHDLFNDDMNYNLISYDVIYTQNLKYHSTKRSARRTWDPYTLNRLIFIAPPITDRRIQSQIGVFCYFPDSLLNSSLDSIPLQKHNLGEPISFKIKFDAKPKILEELNKIGINNMSLFPDMDGFGRFLTWKLIR